MAVGVAVSVVSAIIIATSNFQHRAELWTAVHSAPGADADPYVVLQVPPHASRSTVRRAFEAQAQG